MAFGLQNKEGIPESHLRKQLAVAVRSIQWSYAIFWSISTRQQGLLEWGNGYYNGDIKTRKTVQPLELNVDKLGLKRSEQLRELYGCLSEGDTNKQARRPSVALSPEDLTDAEWYYLVCMSFTFNPNQGLPGRALANNQHIWLCDAQYADSKVFSRSLLAKSAAIQTVLCFPFLGGVIEMGVTEMVSEDPTLLQHIKTVFLEFPMPICSEKSTSSPWDTDDDEDHECTELDRDVVDTMDLKKLNPIVPFIVPSYMAKEENEFDQDGIKESHANSCEELHASSTNQETEDSFMIEEVNSGASPVQSWQFMDDEFSNCVHGSMNSSESISHTFLNPEKAFSSPKREKITNVYGQNLQECNDTKLGSSDFVTDNWHYTRMLSAILKNSNRLIMASCARNQKSSFVSWMKGGLVDARKPKIGAPQKMLKKILFEVARMHSGCSLKSRKENNGNDGLGKPNSNRINVSLCARNGDHKSSFASWTKGSVVDAQKPRIHTPQKMLKKILFEVSWMHSGCLLKPQKGNDGKDGLGKVDASYFLLERREKLNKQFKILRSMVPSISKFDKASILSDTIKYLKDLERRVEELESCRESVEFQTKGRRKHPDIIERTSDNYGNNDIASVKKPPMNKRKACDIDEMDPEPNWVLPKNDFSVYLTVCMTDKEVLIEIRCPSRESLLLEIMGAMSNLNLDAHSIQSSTVDDILTLSLTSKFRGAGFASVGKIKQAIQRVLV